MLTFLKLIRANTETEGHRCRQRGDAAEGSDAGTLTRHLHSHVLCSCAFPKLCSCIRTEFPAAPLQWELPVQPAEPEAADQRERVEGEASDSPGTQHFQHEQWEQKSNSSLVFVYVAELRDLDALLAHLPDGPAEASAHPWARWPQLLPSCSHV